MNRSRRDSGPPEREPLPSDPTTLPALPAIFHATLASGLDAIALRLTPEQLGSLDAFVRLLLRWTVAINLTGIREPEAVARQHLVDSLSAVSILQEAGARHILDVGSGGGLPGLPIAIALPDTHVVLVESVGKKATFLRTAVVGLGLGRRVDVAAERAEDLARPGRLRERFDAVTVRAVAGLGELIEIGLPLLRVGGLLVAWKQEPLAAELVSGANAARAVGGELRVLPVDVPGLETHRLVVVTKTRRSSPGMPRPPAERRRRPLS